MTIQEAIYCMTSYLPDNEVEHCVNCPYYPNDCKCKSDVAHKMAIRSFEALDGIEDYLKSRIEETKQDMEEDTENKEWYLGYWKGLNESKTVVDTYRKEVEE